LFSYKTACNGLGQNYVHRDRFKLHAVLLAKLMIVADKAKLINFGEHQ